MLEMKQKGVSLTREEKVSLHSPKFTVSLCGSLVFI